MRYAIGSLDGPGVNILGNSGKRGHQMEFSMCDIEATRKLAALLLKEEHMPNKLIARVLHKTETWVNNVLREMEEIANGSTEEADPGRSLRRRPSAVGA